VAQYAQSVVLRDLNYPANQEIMRIGLGTRELH